MNLTRKGWLSLPVFDIPSPPPTLSQPVQNPSTTLVEDTPESTSTVEVTKSPQEDLQFIAKKVVLMDPHCLFTGRVKWSRDDYMVKGIEPDQVGLFDADGDALYLRPTDP